MHIVNPFTRTGQVGPSPYGLPSIWQGQVPTGGVIPFTPTDVSRTTSIYAKHPGYIGPPVPAVSPHLPSPLQTGSNAAQHASATAIARLRSVFESGPAVLSGTTDIVHPVVMTPARAIAGVVGGVIDGATKAGRATFAAARGTVRPGATK